jgi:hypothetical protein
MMNNRIDLSLEQFSNQLKIDTKDITPLANRMHTLASRLPSEAALELKDKIRRYWIGTWKDPEWPRFPVFTIDDVEEKPYKGLKISLLQYLNFPLTRNQFRFSSSSIEGINNKLLELLSYGSIIAKIIYPYTSSNALNYWITTIEEAHAFTERILLEKTNKHDNRQLWFCSVDNEMSMNKALGRYVEGIDGTGHLDLIWGGGGREIEILGSRNKQSIPSLSANTKAGLLSIEVIHQNTGQLFQGQDGVKLQQLLGVRIWQHLIHYRSKLLDLEKIIRISGIALEFYAEEYNGCQELKFSDFDTAMDG